MRGHNQLGIVDYNPFVPALGPAAPSQRRGRRRPARRRSLLQYTSYGESWYKGLASSLSKRFSHGYEFLASYTLSKAEDTSTDFYSFPEDIGRGRNPPIPPGCRWASNPAAERGPSVNDQRHRFVLSGLCSSRSACRSRPSSPPAPAGRSRRAPVRTSTATARAAPTAPGATPPDPLSQRRPQQRDLTRAQFNVDMRLSRSVQAWRRTAPSKPSSRCSTSSTPSNYVQLNDGLRRGRVPRPARCTDAAGRSTYGLYKQALPPRQMQLALKVGF